VSLVVRLPDRWVNAHVFEQYLGLDGSPHESTSAVVRVVVPSNCHLMIDAVVRLLSLLNQLDHCTKRVIVDFGDSETEVFGYLNRVGFLDQLSPTIEVLPNRPSVSGAQQFWGKNRGVVEIVRVERSVIDDTLPTTLSNAVGQACAARPDSLELEGAVWTIFAELISNVVDHSQTSLVGFAALQVYRGANCVKIAVSDSGLGIMQTLRPTIKQEKPRLAHLSDVELLVEVLRAGLSRHGEDRGCGLKGCADKALKYQAELDLRLPSSRMMLQPTRGAYAANQASCFECLPLIWGTHLCFTMQLD